MKRHSLCAAVVLIAAVAIPIHASAQTSQADGAMALIKQLPQECEEPARVLAEARLSKWRKTGKDVEKPFDGNAFQTVAVVMKQQCVSVQTVVLLRMVKSMIPAADAVRLNLDAEIDKHMAIIERTL